MKPPSMTRACSFLSSCLAAFTGLGITIIDFLHYASLVLGIVGSCLAIAGGWYAFRIKRLEWQEKTAERRRRLALLASGGTIDPGG